MAGSSRPDRRWTDLTATEWRVVELVSRGLSNPEIARRLSMARSTVKCHLSHVFLKVAVRSRAELASAAAVYRLMEGPQVDEARPVGD